MVINNNFMFCLLIQFLLIRWLTANFVTNPPRSYSIKVFLQNSIPTKRQRYPTINRYHQSYKPHKSVALSMTDSEADLLCIYGRIDGIS